MKEFNALPDPPADSTGKVEVAAGDFLTFDMTLKVGKNPQYEIVWGDGKTETIDGSVLTNPLVFSVSHKYTESGNYTVLRRVYNNDAELVLDPLSVEVSLCIFPQVNFVQSSPASPLIYPRGSSFDLTARWTYTSLKCESWQKPKFKMVSWSLKESNVTLSYPEIEEEFKPDLNKWNAHVPRLVLPDKSFVVHLQLTDQIKVKDYYAYLKIIQTPLVAEITNGMERSISASQFLDDGNTTFLNFSVDALPSHDPDDKVAQHRGTQCSILLVLDSTPQGADTAQFSFQSCF